MLLEDAPQAAFADGTFSGDLAHRHFPRIEQKLLAARVKGNEQIVRPVHEHRLIAAVLGQKDEVARMGEFMCVECERYLSEGPTQYEVTEKMLETME